jgi:mannitol/fructose-specific phosphotransferase system IIA component (Ntr-type)
MPKALELASFTRPELIFLNLAAKEGAEILGKLSEKVAAAGVVPDSGALLHLLLERETLCSTGIGSGIAIPHCKLKHLEHPVLAVGTSETALEFGALDGKPVQVFFLLVSPEDAPAEHLQVLAGISKWIKDDPDGIRNILEAETSEAVFALLPGGSPSEGSEDEDDSP